MFDYFLLSHSDLLLLVNKKRLLINRLITISKNDRRNCHPLSIHLCSEEDAFIDTLSNKDKHDLFNAIYTNAYNIQNVSIMCDTLMCLKLYNWIIHKTSPIVDFWFLKDFPHCRLSIRTRRIAEHCCLFMIRLILNVRFTC